MQSDWASLINYSINYQELDAFNDGDPAFDGKVDTYIKPNFGAGVYLHSDKFYLGFSSPTLLTSNDESATASDSTYDDAFDQTSNIFATAGVLIKITDNFSVKPDALLK
ncbi:MAG: type IX secretion system membrane protein PorP/SprF [Bacteroidetes bacterium]|nr:type IX secretion system membrane protein PorP/SprF [Bacteroidota bacterium]